MESRLKHYQQHLRSELGARGIYWVPHLWVSDEWFCPDGVPGIAMPFYLFHPQLMKIQKIQLGFVEGSTERQIMRLLRHELGHAIDNAYGLRKDSLRQQIFGSSRKAYPIRYLPNLYSTKYVNYLGDGYAQSHPDEDFAETFATWLDPKSDWVNRYHNTPAFEKLLCIDKIMKSLKSKKPKLTNKFCIEPYLTNKDSLKKYILKKRRSLRLDRLHYLDSAYKRHLQRNGIGPQSTLVGDYLALHREKLAQTVSDSTGEYKYLVERAINITIKRAQSQRWTAAKGALAQASSRLIKQNLETLKEQHLLDYYL